MKISKKLIFENFYNRNPLPAVRPLWNFLEQHFKEIITFCSLITMISIFTSSALMLVFHRVFNLAGQDWLKNIVVIGFFSSGYCLLWILSSILEEPVEKEDLKQRKWYQIPNHLSTISIDYRQIILLIMGFVIAAYLYKILS